MCQIRMYFVGFLFSTLLAVLPQSVNADETIAKVVWRHDYGAARNEAKTTGRPLLIDFGTRNCFWCKKLDLVTFRDAAVVHALNTRFVPLKVQAENEPALVRHLGIRVYPTLVLASPHGEILESVEGFQSTGPFLQLLRKTLAATTSIEKTNPREDVPVTTTVVSPSRSVPLDRKNDPEHLRKVCESLKDQLATSYLALAEALLHKAKPQDAALCLEQLIQTFPQSRQAAMAASRLKQIRGSATTRAVTFEAR